MGNCFESCSKRNDNEDDNLDSSVNSKPFSRKLFSFFDIHISLFLEESN